MSTILWHCPFTVTAQLFIDSGPLNSNYMAGLCLQTFLLLLLGGLFLSQKMLLTWQHQILKIADCLYADFAFVSCSYLNPFLFLFIIGSFSLLFPIYQTPFSVLPIYPTHFLCSFLSIRLVFSALSYLSDSFSLLFFIYLTSLCSLSLSFTHFPGLGIHSLVFCANSSFFDKKSESLFHCF